MTTIISPFVLLLTPDEQTALMRYVDGMVRKTRREAIEECIAVVKGLPCEWRYKVDADDILIQAEEALRALLERDGYVAKPGEQTGGSNEKP